MTTYLTKSIPLTDLVNVEQPSRWLADNGFDTDRPVEMHFDPAGRSVEYRQLVEDSGTVTFTGEAETRDSIKPRLMSDMFEAVDLLNEDNLQLIGHTVAALLDAQLNGNPINSIVLGFAEVSDPEMTAEQMEYALEQLYRRRDDVQREMSAAGFTPTIGYTDDEDDGEIFSQAESRRYAALELAILSVPDWSPGSQAERARFYEEFLGQADSDESRRIEERLDRAVVNLRQAA